MYAFNSLIIWKRRRTEHVIRFHLQHPDLFVYLLRLQDFEEPEFSLAAFIEKSGLHLWKQSPRWALPLVTGGIRAQLCTVQDRCILSKQRGTYQTAYQQRRCWYSRIRETFLMNSAEYTRMSDFCLVAAFVITIAGVSPLLDVFRSWCPLLKIPGLSVL